MVSLILIMILSAVYLFIFVILVLYGINVVNNWSSRKKNIFEIYNDDI